jgi:glycosyltransferase involved in cell wall biosynthesis
MSTVATEGALPAPFFSIGVTTYDRLELLAYTVRSILMQGFTDYEVLIGNDNPARFLTLKDLGLEEDARIRIVNRDPNLGEWGNMNRLLQESCGRYFTWIADDDLYAPDFLAQIQAALRQFAFPSCIFTAFGRIGPGETSLPVGDGPAVPRLYSGEEFLRLYLRRRITAIGVMGVFRRTYLLGEGGLEDLSGQQQVLFSEYLLLLKTGRADHVAYVSKPLVYHRSHAGSWGMTNQALDLYQTVGEQLLRRSLDVLLRPGLRRGFILNYYAILSLCMGSYVTCLERLSQLTPARLVVHLFYAARYVRLAETRGVRWPALVSYLLACGKQSGRFLLLKLGLGPFLEWFYRLRT